MSHHYYEKQSHVELYAKVRPSPPPEVVNYIINCVKEKVPLPLGHAVDVACGSGQSTRVLAPFFEKVTGLDLSSAQILEAKKYPNLPTNISYGISAAEKLPFPDKSITLVTTCQSFHWFDADAFLKEAKRILIPNGVLAIYGHKMPKPLYPNFSEQLGDLTIKNISDLQQHYCPVDKKDADNGFINLVLPLADFRRETFVFEPVKTAQDYFDFIESHSSYQKSKVVDSEKADKFLKDFQEKFLKVIQRSGEDLSQISINMQFEYFILLGRKD